MSVTLCSEAKRVAMFVGGMSAFSAAAMTFIWLPVFALNPLLSAEPFAPGETLVYALRWGPFKVGTARIEITGPVTFGSENAYRCKFVLRTNGFADAFYRVRDEYISYVDLEFNRTLHFEKRELHRNRARKVTVEFDWDQRISTFTINGEEQPVVSLPDNVLDPVAVIFATRREALKVGGRWRFKVTNGKRFGDIPFRVVAAEPIATPGLSGESFRLEPEMGNVSEAFKGNSKTFLKVWVSADTRHIPMKAACRMKYGKFRADLVEVLSDMRDDA